MNMKNFRSSARQEDIRLILDVGCGNKPCGHVNVDLYMKKSQHRLSSLKKIPNLVKADALHLPFAANSFLEVHSNHLIEHLEEPEQFIRECLRVAKERVVITCPHRYSRQGLRLKQSSTAAHKNFFSVSWFHQTLSYLPHKVSCSTVPKPHKFIPLIQLPHEIRIEVLKI